MATPSVIGERALYESVKLWLERVLKERYAYVHLEVTANRVFSNYLQSQIDTHRELVFAFLQEAAPDITGLVQRDPPPSFLKEFVVVEIKNTTIKLDDIYQTRKYAELFDARHAFLLSTREIPERLMRLSRVVPSLLTLQGGYGRMTLVSYQDDGRRSDWLPEYPFK